MKLDHPQIVPVYDVGEVGGQFYFTMQLVEGGSLQQQLAAGPMPPAAAARLVCRVAQAVQHAHDQGIFHRDLKPGNILLHRERTEAGGDSAEGSAGAPTAFPESTPKLTDFGLARTLDSDLSATGEILGTPSYMPPEQVRGRHREVGAASDVYGLGAVLYCLLTGRPPFQAADPYETMRQVCEEEPVSPRQLNRNVAPDLATVCLKCLEKEPRKRYASARELVDELGRFLEARPVQARPVGSLERVWRWCQRNPVVAGLLLLIVALLVVGIGAGTYSVALARGRARLEDALGETEEARDRAEAEKERAEAATEEAERQKGAAETAREETEQFRYFNQIQFVYREWENNNVGRARDLLETTAKRLRGWEYDYLNTLINDPQRTLLGHTGPVERVCFSPDGKRVASASGDETVKVWDAQTGQAALTLTGHTGEVRSVAFSPDGKDIISGGGDGFKGEVKVWDAQTGQEALTLTGHTSVVTSVAFSADGKRLVSGSQDQTVRVWDAHTGQEALTLKGHTNQVMSVAFSADGKRIASGSDDQMVKVWDVQTGQETLTLKGHTRAVQSVCFSPHGKSLISRDRNGVRIVWDLSSGKRLPDAQELERANQPVSPNGKWIAHVDGEIIRVVRLLREDERPRLRWLALPNPTWHEQQVRDSEERLDWFGAAFHLGRLLQFQPWNAAVQVRQARVLARLGRTEEAALAYLSAVSLSPHISLWPRDPGAAFRGESAANGGHWLQAVEHLQLAAHQPGAPIQTWCSLLLAQGAAGQEGPCRQSCQEMLDRFEATRDLKLVWSVVDACRTVPCGKSDAGRVVRLAERLVAAQRNAANLDFLGGALYRAGHFEQAARTLEEAIKQHGKGGYLDTWLFLAMTRQRLGQVDEARRRLGVVEDELKKVRYPHWQYKVYRRLLQEEARVLILRMPPVPEGQ